MRTMVLIASLLMGCGDERPADNEARGVERDAVDEIMLPDEDGALAHGWDGACDWQGFASFKPPYTTVALVNARSREFELAADFGCLAAAACVIDKNAEFPQVAAVSTVYHTSVMASLWGFEVATDPGRGWMDPADPNDWSTTDDEARQRFSRIQRYLAHTGQTSAEAVPNCPAFAPRPVDPERVLFDPEACMELAHVPACVPYADAGERARLGLPPREEEGG